ncbi:MAG TPA: hypothetical protein ENI65_12325 [Gammaproteobacteria bacterium]|nr:hypothetical protein [Gammaproteobacteria bacterium]
MKRIIFKLSATLFMYVMYMPAYAQQNGVAGTPLLASGESLAYEMGKTYQLAKNCGQNLDNIAEPRAVILLLNYLEENDVKTAMRQYKHSLAREKGKSCNLEKIEIHTLMNKIAKFMRQSASFARQ